MTQRPDLPDVPSESDPVSGEAGGNGEGRGSSPGPRWSRIARRVLFGCLAVGVAGAAGIVLYVAHLARDLPSVHELENYAPPQMTRVRARDGTLLANVFRERRTVIPFEEIPDHAKLAFLAAEDAAFYEHEGLDYFGMLRAFVANLRAGATRQGGSTITQQVVKNVLLDSGRTIRRKVRETILARHLEQELSKDRILGLYLNHIYLGHGRYGIEEASRYYFGKKARNLDLGEASMLAGIVAAPERFSPRNHPERGLERRRYVVRQMVHKGFLEPDVAKKVEALPLRLAPAVEAESELGPEAVGQALRALRDVTGEAKAGGYEVTTTIDPRLQAAARTSVRDALDAYAQRHELAAPFTDDERKDWGPPASGNPRLHRIHVGVVQGVDDHLGTIDVKVGDVVGRVFLGRESRFNPKGLVPSEFTKEGAVLRVALLAPSEPGTKPPLRLELGPQAALVAIDIRSREVVALVGSYEALAGGLDRATRARRQPGSAFKPIIYSYALHSRHITPATVLSLEQPEGNDEATRKIDVRTALAKSDNDAARWIFRTAGPENIVEWARALGIESPLKPDLSLSLGSYEVTPLELANAYVTVAGGGTAGAPLVVSSITNRASGAVELPPRPPERRVMSPEEAYLTTSLMKSVVDFGTGRRASSIGRPLAGKTGTTNDARDAWFVGFSTDYVVAVWVGWDDSKPLGKRESGARTALPAWIDFMKVAHEGRPPVQFARPASIVVARVDPETGLLARPDAVEAREEEFLPGTEPTELTPEPLPDGGVRRDDESGAPDESNTARDAGSPFGLGFAEDPPPF